MKIKILCFVIATSALNANSQTFEWAKQMRGTSTDVGHSITIDATGNVYTTGYFEETIDFDPGVGTFNLTSAGNRDFFISKLDASGNFVWAKKFGGFNSDVGQSIAVDASGNVYTAGYFQGTVDFDPGIGSFNLTSIGGLEIFILKLDASGNFVWAKQMGGGGNDYLLTIAVDSLGNVYSTGYFEGKADFNPGIDTFYLTSASNRNIFISKLDASGNFVWAKQFMSSSTNTGYSIAVDGFGNVYTTGYLQGTMDFDPGASTFNLSSFGVTDIFISKLDSMGNFMWAKQLGGGNSDIGHSITVDAFENVYTIGTFEGTADFDPGTDTFKLTSAGSAEIFISKLDASGNFVWAKRLGGINYEQGKSIAIDAFGNVYSTGYFYGTADFDPGTDTFNLTSAGSADIFISKLDAKGNFVWAKKIGGLSRNYGNSIAVDASNNVYTTGFFEGTADFDPWGSNFNLTSSGSYDIFVHKMSQCVKTSIQSKTACDSYTWIDGNNYTSSNNTSTYTLTNATGCDSIVTLNLTMNYSNTGTDVITACDSYTWINGNTYTSSNNTATHTLSNAAGCDSIVTLNLTMNYSNTGTDVITACDSYTWIDGNTYTSSNNTATHTLSNTAGCDSVVTLNLTIKRVSNITTLTSGLTLSANNSIATYQWLDCDSDFAEISGETGQTYIVTAIGNYAVELTENGCVDTSTCVAITTLSILENSFGSGLLIYPNPTNGNFSIDLGFIHENVQVLITDISGKLIDSKTTSQTQVLNLSIQEPTGIYIVSIQAGDKKAVIRLVKE